MKCCFRQHSMFYMFNVFVAYHLQLPCFRCVQCHKEKQTLCFKSKLCWWSPASSMFVDTTISYDFNLLFCSWLCELCVFRFVLYVWLVTLGMNLQGNHEPSRLWALDAAAFAQRKRVVPYFAPDVAPDMATKGRRVMEGLKWSVDDGDETPTIGRRKGRTTNVNQ